MTTATTDIRATSHATKPRPGFLARALASFFHRIETGGHLGARRRRLEALEARTDAELAAMGLRRENIMHHVFRDLYYV